MSKSYHYNPERDCLEDIQAWIEANEVQDEFKKLTDEQLIKAIKDKIDRTLEKAPSSIPLDRGPNLFDYN